MPGDYTRCTFDPFDDHFGVLMQQGRVTLDADFNELVAILDRQLRVRTLDTIGRGVVPRETLDGFRIEVAGGILTIGRGRAYVHGLLADNHGTGDLEWDPVLAEQRGTEATPYDAQPYLPDPPPFGIGPNDPGAVLVYLDVWQRELTHVEDPDLVEKALGVDTATRLQTVWQVKLLPVPRETTCATPDEDLPDWLELTRPSGGRLSTRAVGVPADDDPCILDPAGGYRGTENRLYRVEVHDPGDLDTATFKWSRDNASIATRVLAIDAGLDTLTVVRLGRDGVRRFASQDWVEVIDDRLELHGQPGVLRKVQSVDPVAETITLEDPLPAGVFDAADPQALDTRIRRWDQKGQVLDATNAVVADVDANDGAIPVGAGGGTMVLEDGVEVTFSVDAAPELDEFRTGDSWVFAARTVDASVEALETAPPKAIHHHYCRLAVVRPGEEVIDCRVFWPPEFGEEGCDCTECVSAEEHNSGVFTIQMALDRVRAAGGKVCLGPGVFNLGTQPVELHGMTSVQLQGHGFRTILFYAGDGPAVSVGRSIDIVLERFAVAALFGQELPSAALGIIGSQAVRVERTALLQLGGRDRGGPAVILSGVLAQVALEDNFIFGRDGIRAVTIDAANQPPPGIALPPRSFLATFGLSISENLILAERRVIDLGRESFHLGDTRIDDNQLVGGRSAALRVEGFVPFQAFPSRLEVRGNVVTTSGDGLVVATHQARLRDNDIGILGERQEEDGVEHHGIVLAPGIVQTPLEGCQVLANRITGLSGDGIHVAASIGSAMIKQNVLRDLGGGGIVMAVGTDARVLTIENNQLLDVARRDPRGGSLTAIRVLSADQLEIASNAIDGFAVSSLQTVARLAIEVHTSASTRIAGNDLRRIGPGGDAAGRTVGVLVVRPLENLGIHDNSIHHGGEELAARGRWTGILVTGPVETRPDAAGNVGSGPATGFGNVGGFTGRAAASAFAGSAFGRVHTLELDDDHTAVVDDFRIVVIPRSRDSIAVDGNFVDGAGDEPMVLVLGRGTVTLSTNRVVAAAGEGMQTVVQAGGREVIASSNSILRRPGGDLDALRLAVSPERMTVLGNIVEGGQVRVGTDTLGQPWRPLNVITF